MELFAKLGIDWRLLTAQLVNFVILMTALFFLLFKPILAALEKRRTKIAESLANAEKIGDELKRTNAETERLLVQARSEAQSIVTEANRLAEAAKQAAVDKTKTEIAGLVAAGRAQLGAERDTMVNEVRAAAADLVALATAKVIGEKLTAAKDKALIEKVIDSSRT